MPNIAVYGVELLVRQLMDESLMVASTALNILDEVGSVELDSFKTEDWLMDLKLDTENKYIFTKE